MRKISVLIWLLAMMVSLASADKNILELDESDFNQTVAKYDHVLVVFTTTDESKKCEGCQTLEKELKITGEELSISAYADTIKIARIDPYHNKRVAMQNNIKGLPTLKWFKKGQFVRDYNGKLEGSEITDWTILKAGNPSLNVDCSQIDVDWKNEFTLVYFGDMSNPAFDVHYSLSQKFDDEVTYLHNTDTYCAKSFNIREKELPVFVLIRKFHGKTDNEWIEYSDDLEEEVLFKWLKEMMVPDVFEFLDSSVAKTFGAGNDLVILFRKRITTKASLMNKYERIAEKLRGTIQFAYSDIAHNDMQKTLSQQLRVFEEDLPAIRYVNSKMDKKWVSDFEPKNMTVAKMTQFISKVRAGEIEPFYRSDPIPETNDGVVKVIVAEQFDQYVKDKSKNLVIEFYATWCTHCKELAPIYERIAENLKDQKDLVIAKMEAMNNEVPGLKIEGFPLIMFYGKNSQQPVKYDGEKEEEAIQMWIELRKIQDSQKPKPAPQQPKMSAPPSGEEKLDETLEDELDDIMEDL